MTRTRPGLTGAGSDSGLAPDSDTPARTSGAGKQYWSNASQALVKPCRSCQLRVQRLQPTGLARSESADTDPPSWEPNS
jgi:hypothetical protein